MMPGIGQKCWRDPANIAGAKSRGRHNGSAPLNAENATGCGKLLACGAAKGSSRLTPGSFTVAKSAVTPLAKRATGTW